MQLPNMPTLAFRDQIFNHVDEILDKCQLGEFHETSPKENNVKNVTRRYLIFLLSR